MRDTQTNRQRDCERERNRKRNRNGDRGPDSGTDWEKASSFRRNKIFCFVSGFIFFFAVFLYSIVWPEWAQHFTLFMLIFVLPFVLCCLLSLPATTGNLFDCWSACIFCFFTFLCVYIYAHKPQTDRQSVGGSYLHIAICRYIHICIVLVVDIYFMSQITFIETWHTLEIHV